jgi:hypothetical protein
MFTVVSLNTNNATRENLMNMLALVQLREPHVLCLQEVHTHKICLKGWQKSYISGIPGERARYTMTFVRNGIQQYPHVYEVPTDTLSLDIVLENGRKITVHNSYVRVSTNELHDARRAQKLEALSIAHGYDFVSVGDFNALGSTIYPGLTRPTWCRTGGNRYSYLDNAISNLPFARRILTPTSSDHAMIQIDLMVGLEWKQQEFLQRAYIEKMQDKIGDLHDHTLAG